MERGVSSVSDDGDGEELEDFSTATTTTTTTALNDDDDGGGDGDNSDEMDELVAPPVEEKPGLKALMRGAPRDLWILIVLTFSESLAYFCTTMVFIQMLEREHGMSDKEASTAYALFGIAISTFSIAFGWVVDRLLVRRSMMLYVSLGIVSKLLMGLFPSRVMLWVTMLGPLSFALSIGGSASMVAMRRYTHKDSRAVAMAVAYISMNFGAMCAEGIADVIRIKFVPLMETLHIKGFSMFVSFTAVLHIINFALVYFFIRDVYVPEDDISLGDTIVDPVRLGSDMYLEVRSLRWELRVVSKPSIDATLEARPSPWLWMTSRDTEVRGRGCQCRRALASFKESCRRIVTQIKARMTWDLLCLTILSISVLGARAVFRFLDSLFPLYMVRAPFPSEHPEDVPFQSFLVINSVIVILLTTPLANLFARRHFHPYWVVLVGVTISAVSPFLVTITQYWAVIVFIIIMSLGEVVWSPMVANFSYWFSPQGKEGSYGALSSLPIFLAKGGAGYASGWVLERYCPLDGVECSSVLWLFVGVMAATSPLILAASYKLLCVEKPVEVTAN